MTERLSDSLKCVKWSSRQICILDFLHTHFPRVPVPIVHPRKDYHAQLVWDNKELDSDKMLSGVPVVGVSAEGKREGLAFAVAMTPYLAMGNSPAELDTRVVRCAASSAE